MFFQGIQTIDAKKPYRFVIFQGGGGGFSPPIPSLAPRMKSKTISSIFGRIMYQNLNCEITDIKHFLEWVANQALRVPGRKASRF